jgi:signal transduction histidine kinase
VADRGLRNRPGAATPERADGANGAGASTAGPGATKPGGARPGGARQIGRWWLRHGLGPVLVHWWRRRGLRARVTLIAALGLLVALSAGALLLFNTLRVSLNRSVDDTARSGATEVAALINADRLPNPVPVAAGTVTIQVLGPSGRIVNVSAGADRLVPMVAPAQAAALANGDSAILVHGAPFDMPSLLRVAAVRANGGELVIAAVPYSSAADSLQVVGHALVFGTPVLFIAFTGAIWLAVGSTLRPIDRIRRGAARVTGTGVPADLPVPEARDEVRSLALTLNDMLSRLTSAQQRQRSLVSDTAHELRSPIASIRTQLEVALDHPVGQDWASTARDVLADTLRLSRLTEDLLLLARLDEQADHGDMGRHGEPLDLGALARMVVARYADSPVPVTVTPPETDAATPAEAAPGMVDAAEKADVAGRDPSTPASAWPVRGNADRLDRMLVNLIDNAVRYAKSSVTVSVGQSGPWVELAVTDDGPGIPEPDRERAFDRFARLDDARTRCDDDAGGAGLGLAIVRATAHSHAGTAQLESAPDGAPGLRATVRLPVATEAP